MDSSNGMNAAQDNLSSPALAPAAVSNTAEVANERLFKQSEVNVLIGRAKHEAVEKDRQLREQQPNYAQSKFPDVGNTQIQQQPGYSNAPVDMNEIRRIAAEEAARTRDEIYLDAQNQAAKAQWDRVSQTYDAKISSGKEKYPDFEKVTDIDMTGYPAVKQILAEHVDNAADVLYELGKDRFRLHQLEAMGRDQYHWKDAIVQAQRLAQSIKDNESATKVRLPNEPLSQMRPSHTGTDSGQALSFAELRQKYRG